MKDDDGAAWALALGLLFQVDVGETSLRDAAALSEELAAASPEVADRATEMAARTAGNLRRIDRYLKAHARHYSVERLPAVERSILRLAISALLLPGADAALIIRRAEALGRTYAGSGAPPFLRGVIGAVAAALVTGPEEMEAPASVSREALPSTPPGSAGLATTPPQKPPAPAEKRKRTYRPPSYRPPSSPSDRKSAPDAKPGPDRQRTSTRKDGPPTRPGPVGKDSAASAGKERGTPGSRPSQQRAPSGPRTDRAPRVDHPPRGGRSAPRPNAHEDEHGAQ